MAVGVPPAGDVFLNQKEVVEVLALVGVPNVLLKYALAAERKRTELAIW